MQDAATWIDSHAHLTMFEPGEVGEVLERAGDAGVGGVLVPATCRDDLGKALELAAEHPGRVVAAAGIHPHEARTLGASAKRSLECALDRPGVVAVGEIGLDYHYMNSPREDQLAALAWQLDVAFERGLPVILHNRESWSDLEAALAARSPGLSGVCHSFTESADRALRVVELGLVVGISGMVTFRAADSIRAMAAALDPRSVLVETDSPYLAPMPHRGRRNEPAFVPLVGQRLAAIWAVDQELVARASTDLFRRLFGLDPTWPAPAVREVRSGSSDAARDGAGPT